MTITTILLILAVVVVGYALYAFFAAGTPDYMAPKALCEEEPKAQTVIETEEGEQPTAVEEPASATGAHEETSAPIAEEASAAEGANAVSATEPAKITEFRNPETSETAANPSNYRFAKKWIKQAMVDEGLLDKVYKNKELKGTTEKKVKEALNRFKQLEKYHG